jgi:hypothetical protein
MKRTDELLAINLSEWQSTLDKQGVEIIESQKESVTGRKALSDKTKGRGCVSTV